jgi:hypothetical protein
LKDAQGNLVLGRTRWRRFAAVMLPAVAAAGAIVFGIANGAIAASFDVSGSTFKVSADDLEGDGFVQYGGTVHQKATNTNIPVAVSGISSATLANLCQSVVVPNAPISLVIRAGNSGTPASATNLLIDMTSLKGDATFTNINIGQDASTLTDGPTDGRNVVGGFGQQATHVSIKHLQQIAWSTSAGTFVLNGLDMHLSVQKNPEECF